LPSGGSNLAPSSTVLAVLAAEREAEFRRAHSLTVTEVVPVEMLFSSGSGLDPHISPGAAQMQAGRVAQARGLPKTLVTDMVSDYIEGPQLGFLGQSRVNVLLLNLALDGLQ
jgi:K+-transporting ATPase ATPase C chain